MSIKRKWKLVQGFNAHHAGKEIAILSPSGKQVWIVCPPRTRQERIPWADFLLIVS